LNDEKGGPKAPSPPDASEPEATIVTSLESIYSQKKEPDLKKLYLIVIAGNAVGEMYQIRKESVEIGRESDCDITIRDVGISRRHARISRSGSADIYIEDLGSTNGTYINGEQIAKKLLNDGDRIQLGRTTILKFSLSDSLEESFQKKMYESAVRDGLTKTYNRQYFDERLASEFSYAYRHYIPLSVIMVDIDHFKKVNDTYGHPVGDVVLRVLSQTMMKSIRNEDMLSRYGGEEFTILARNTDAQAIITLAERIRVAVESQAIPVSAGIIKITVSAGCATLENRNYHRPEELVAAADEALYHAKKSGRNRVVQAVPSHESDLVPK
jgi:two-component system cell cycle response regulator